MVTTWRRTGQIRLGRILPGFTQIWFRRYADNGEWLHGPDDSRIALVPNAKAEPLGWDRARDACSELMPMDYLGGLDLLPLSRSLYPEVQA